MEGAGIATHRFPLGDTMDAYDVFAAASTTQALKVVLEGTPVATGLAPKVAATAPA